VKARINKVKGSIKDFFKNFYRVIRRNDMVILPGNLAFYFVLAIIPTLTILSYGASILNLSTDVIYDFIAHSFSRDIADIILGVNLHNVVGFDFIITLVVGIYISTNGADAMILASNKIYNIKDKSWIKRRFKALGMTFLLTILLLFMLIVPVFGNIITGLVQEVNINPIITNRIVMIFDLIQGPITWIIMFIIIKMLYTIAPDQKKGSGNVSYGALFTTIMFVVGTKAYSMYVTKYATYATLYGGLANIIVLMIWIYFLSLIFTIGMALNYEKEEGNAPKIGTN